MAENETAIQETPLKKSNFRLISFLIALIAAKAIILLGNLLSLFVQRMPLVAGLLLGCSVIVAIYFGVIIFKKLVKYLSKELA